MPHGPFLNGGAGNPRLLPAMSDYEWLAPEGEYRELARSLCAADPRLRRRDFDSIARGVPWPAGNARACVLNYREGREPLYPADTFDAEGLRRFLQQRMPPSSEKRTVVILEGLSPDFIHVLGDQYGIHPSMFVDHERTHHSSVYHRLEPGSLLVLPAISCTRDYTVLYYVELVKLPQLCQGKFSIFCGTTGRLISVTRACGQFRDVGLARRKCTIWTRRNEGSCSWDCQCFLLS